jgi:hypothetical protein
MNVQAGSDDQNGRVPIEAALMSVALESQRQTGRRAAEHRFRRGIMNEICVVWSRVSLTLECAVASVFRYRDLTEMNHRCRVKFLSRPVRDRPNRYPIRSNMYSAPCSFHEHAVIQDQRI